MLLTRRGEGKREGREGREQRLPDGARLPDRTGGRSVSGRDGHTHWGEDWLNVFSRSAGTPAADASDSGSATGSRLDRFEHVGALSQASARSFNSTSPERFLVLFDVVDFAAIVMSPVDVVSRSSSGSRW